MTTEDLLKPRYKVIGLFPHTDFKIGDIVDGTPYENNWGVDFKDFPVVFKPLEWYKERSEDEMPEYVKWDNEPEVYKVIKWEDDNLVGRLGKNSIITMCKNVYPATKEEYEKQNLTHEQRKH